MPRPAHLRVFTGNRPPDASRLRGGPQRQTDGLHPPKIGDVWIFASTPARQRWCAETLRQFDGVTSVEVFESMTGLTSTLEAPTPLSPTPAILVVDYAPEMRRPRALTRLVQLAGSIPVLAVTDDARLTLPVFRSGVVGVVAHGSPLRLVESVVRMALEGGLLLPFEQARLLLDTVRIEKSVKNLLTHREQEVLELLAEGLSHKEIASRMEIAVSTVNTHLRRLYDKLGVTAAAAAVSQGFRRGLL